MLSVETVMRYTYVVAWSVVGGISLPNESQPIELMRSDRCRFILTREPDSLLANLDRGNAVRTLMLKGLFGQRETADFSIALASEIEEIRSARKKKAAANAILILEAYGIVEAIMEGPAQEHDDFVVTFDAIDKKTIRGAHRSEIDGMKTALAFESEVPSRFTTLAEGIYLTDSEGRTVYSLTFSMSAEGSASSGITPEGAARISQRYGLLQKAGEMDSVQRLFGQMADFETDRLKVFLSGWAALEIFIAKSFKAYEETFLSPLINAGQPTLRERFLERVKGVMKDKYRLTDKFVAVTAVLFPGASEVSVQDDLKKFSRLKELRDSIFHGDEFSERDLPVRELSALLRKYMLAYLETPNQAVNPDAPTSGAPVT